MQRKNFGKAYKYRVVKNTNQLREKVLIFEKNLSDEAVEFLKYIFVGKAIIEMPDLRVDEAYFDFDKNNRMFLRIYGSRNLITDVQFSDYFNIFKMLAEEFDVPDDLIIDWNWARQLAENNL